MPSTRSASADLRVGLELIEVATAASNHDQFAATVLPRLNDLLCGDSGTYVEVGHERPTNATAVGIPHPRGYAELLEVWRTRNREHPWVAQMLTTADVSALRLTDMVSSRELMRTAFFHDFFLPRDVRHGLYVHIGRTQQELVGIGVVRRTGDFSERERGLLNILRGPLSGAWAQLSARAELEVRVIQLSTTRREHLADRTQLARLTESERQTAVLVARGLDNRAVARARHVSVKAVEQHLTSVYRKLGVSSRTHLLARYGTVLTLPEPRDSPIAQAIAPS
jgi:DNA-binding CsgD family transcriptional regulator